MPGAVGFAGNHTGIVRALIIEASVCEVGVVRFLQFDLGDPVRLPAEAIEACGGDRGIAGQAGDLERRLGQRGWQLPCQ